MIRYLFEGQVYSITVLTAAGAGFWLIRGYDDRIIIEKCENVHIAAVMADVDSVIRDQKARIARANPNSLYDMLEANHTLIKVGYL